MTTNYGLKALLGETEKIRQLSNGMRNAGSVHPAMCIFELVHGGEISRDDAVEALLETITSTGLSRHEARSIIRSAERKTEGKARSAKKSSEVQYTGPRWTPTPPPVYADPKVIRSIAVATKPVLDDDIACAFLDQRGIDPERIAELKAARVLPKDAELPRTQALEDALSGFRVNGRRRDVLELGFRLVLPLVDVCGELRSLQLRSIDGQDADLPTKGVCLKPQRKKLVMANRSTQALLRPGAAREAFWQDRDAEIVITEGETDYLCALAERTDYHRAVLGIFQGSWAASYAAKIPDNARLVIATDDDDQGHAYAAKIQETLRGRHFYRWKPNRGKDVCDAGGLAGGQCSDGN